MRDILIVGAGKIGTVIADLLAGSGDYAVTVADRDPAAVERVGAELARVQACALDVADADALFLHRKLGGLYLLAARLKARVEVGALAARWIGGAAA